MSFTSRIEEKLKQRFQPEHFELENESPRHGLPVSAEKHFRVVVVSSDFADLSRVDRHRLVHEVLAEELREHVHALSVQAYTPDEWVKKAGQAHASPPCGGRHGG